LAQITTADKVAASGVEDKFLRNDGDDTSSGGLTLGGNTIVDGNLSVNGTLLGQTAVQIVNTQTATPATGTTMMVNDNTIPQNTEGDQYMTLAITPTSATNILRIEAIVHGTSGQYQHLMALFQDTTANALSGCVWHSETGGNYCHPGRIIYWMAAGTTSSTTFKIRAGTHTSDTFYFNGTSSGYDLGDRLHSSITITEYKT